MFRPLAMQRVALHVLIEDAAVAAAVLAERGVFNPESSQALAGQLPDFPGEKFREIYRDARSKLDKVLAHCGAREALTPLLVRRVDETELEQLDVWLRAVWLECSKCQEGLRRIEEEQKRIAQLMRTLDNFAALDIDLGLLARSKQFLDVHVGMVPAANLVRLREAVGLAGYILAPFLHAEGVEHVVIAGPTGNEDEVKPVLQAAGWRVASVPPELRDHPEKVRRELRERQDRIIEETDAQCRLIESTQKEFREKLTDAARTLALAAPYAELGEALRGRGGLALIGGWVPRTDLSELRRALQEKLGQRFVLSARDPLPEEIGRVPSAMRHHWLAQPFARLVKNYGVPRYGEIDPTIMFAITIIAMFGMMFGDVGHGAVIALAGVVLRRRLHGFAPFLVAAGAASAGFGWLYGSVFGFEELVHPLWIAPLTNPVRMLTVALYWGIGFIVLGTLLTIYNRLVERRYLDAFLDGKGVAGLLFYVGVLYGIYRWLDAGVFGAVEWGSILAPLALMLAYKWHGYRGHPGERVLVVLIEGFETAVSYFANSLSFLRVAAFGLNHVALAVAVFALARMMHTAGHWVTVIVGNIFIIILEGAIVGIQALRLEYYEGFSRFFSGDGREFRPLSLAVR
ncbi:MAG: V-type ATP synthase subunit I [Acidiferrobacterales bacterium]